ncbi:heavy metal translocating P-type ATPase [Sphingobium sp. YG1]|jgi:Cd2+/Zn2+-exporting ATPase|uniref:heavy metal translocating P-type ATPase n=1 Tax=Sphingobium sp. YG1 TaxID=2082188 RepID=UPI000DBB3D8A|nr:heavy metal translocating P-type ATPase [Sphingobium sp. YG1]BBD02201.1 Cd2+/Zn2+-exporting ATPase [Sphingobium sp. YG1]
MFEQTEASAIASERRWRFKVHGLDCQNEVRLLREALIPLVGDERFLSFQPKHGLLDVDIESGIGVEVLIAAISATGMSAELETTGSFAEDEADVGGCSGCSGEPEPVKLALADRPNGSIFKIHGMDCGDEVAVLKREVGPVVGLENLSFDLINGRMSVAGSSAAAQHAGILKAVERTGMRAELWKEGGSSAGALEEQRRRRVQAGLTVTSGAMVMVGFAIHARANGFAAVLHESLARETHPPLLAMLAYSLAILSAVRYVAPKAILAARRLRPDMNLLMLVAVAGALGIGQWFEAATVAFFFALALALEAWSLGRARRAVAALMEIAPDSARIRDVTGVEKDVPVAEVAVGTHVIVPPGGKIPLDGRVVAGTSAVNQAPITGESVPVTVAQDAVVYAGTINGMGALEIVTTRPASDTTLARIVRMVGEAQSKRAPTEQWVERFARIYTPVVMALSLAVFLVPPLLLGGGWAAWFYQGLVLLVIACPCALVISTPVSIVAGLTGAARRGVLIKGGIHLETPARITAIAMDKTGTLTLGRPKVVELVPLGGRSEIELLAVATAIEARSEHPIARAILDAAAERGVDAVPAKSVTALPGQGVVGAIDGREVWVGSPGYLGERLGSPGDDELATQLQRIAGAGLTGIVVGEAQSVIGLIAIGDAVRPEARQIVAQLHKLGIAQVVMLTGDSRAPAQAIAHETGVNEVYAELLPEQKVEAIERLVAQHGLVAMVGDGVNDAPAMARASLGIAMGAIGSDAAIETADIALMQDDLSQLPWLIRHSRATLTVIRQNIGFSLAVKLVFGGLTLLGMASLWGAIAADVGASLLVVLNGLRLIDRDQRAR